MKVLFIVLGVVVLLAVVLAILFLYALPRVIVKKMRSSDNADGAMTYPENFNELKSRVKVEKDLIYPSAYPSNEYDLYLPKDKPDQKIPLIIWVHGGGFIAGSKDGGENVMTSLCASGFAVASINYAVAPEHRYPTAINQIHEFTKFLPQLQTQFAQLDTKKLVYGGDSAGAQLVAQYLAVQTNSELSNQMKIKQILNPSDVKSAVLVCGPYDMGGIRRYAKQNNKTLGFLIDVWGRAYYGKLRWHKSQVAKQSVVADYLTQNYPPTFLTDGNSGSFEIQNKRLGAALREKGVETEELYFDEASGKVMHEYLFQLADEKAGLALNRIISFIKSHTN